MLQYTLRRFAQLVPVLFGVSLLSFALMSLIPGDPAQAILGSYATAENLARLRAQLHLDQPWPAQYLAWLQHAVTGDLGQSYSLDRPITQVVMSRLGNTLVLAAAAFVISVLLGVVAGLVAAVWRGRWPDRLTTTLALVGLSTPTFWLAMIFVFVFAVSFGWLPSSGMTQAYGGGGVLDRAEHLVLPALALGMVASGVIARLTRSSMLEVLGQDYLRTARSKGLPERVVVLKHAFKNALVAIIPVIGVQVGFLLGGAVYIETIFNWPGVGSMLVTAISTRDILLVQGGVLVVAVAYVLINLAADLAQAAVDPRIRVQ
jgi:peptide/nickel transport system permease protein